MSGCGSETLKLEELTNGEVYVLKHKYGKGFVTARLWYTRTGRSEFVARSHYKHSLVPQNDNKISLAYYPDAVNFAVKDYYIRLSTQEEDKEIETIEDNRRLEQTKPIDIMKKQHKLDNGTVLKVGEKYIAYDDAKDPEEALYIDDTGVLTIDKDGCKTYWNFKEDCNGFSLSSDITNKTLEDLNCYFIYDTNYKTVMVAWAASKIEAAHSLDRCDVYTIEEAKELGLDLSMFNIK